jgi:hypothetical protein
MVVLIYANTDIIKQLYQQAHIIKLTSAPKSQSILPFETLGMTNRNDTQADHPNFRLMATVALPPGSWDPYRALDLNPNETVTCIGHARSKRQECRSQVSKNSRDKACQILNQLSTRTQKLDDLGAQLRELAQLLLCEAYHQTQADEIVNRWQCNLTFDLFTPPPSPILGLRTRPRTSATPDPTRRNTVHRMSLISPPPDNEPSAIESGNQRPSRGQRSFEGGADQNVDNPRQSANTTSRLR